MVSIANANQLLRTYTWGKDLYGPGGIGGLLSMEIKSGTQQGKYLYSYDAKGNVTQVIKAETGEVVNKYEYDPYGNMTSKVELSGYEDVNEFRFQTKFHDTETGLIYFEHRYYSTLDGRFLNRDPIAERGGINLYGYVMNDPVNGRDYLGMCWMVFVFEYDSSDWDDPWDALIFDDPLGGFGDEELEEELENSEDDGGGGGGGPAGNTNGGNNGDTSGNTNGNTASDGSNTNSNDTQTSTSDTQTSSTDAQTDPTDTTTDTPQNQQQQQQHVSDNPEQSATEVANADNNVTESQKEEESEEKPNSNTIRLLTNNQGLNGNSMIVEMTNKITKETLKHIGEENFVKLVEQVEEMVTDINNNELRVYENELKVQVTAFDSIWPGRNEATIEGNVTGTHFIGIDESGLYFRSEIEGDLNFKAGIGFGTPGDLTFDYFEYPLEDSNVELPKVRIGGPDG